MDLKRDIKDLSQFREFLLKNGLTPADIALVARNKRLKKLLDGKIEIHKDHKRLIGENRILKQEVEELQTVLKASNRGFTVTKRQAGRKTAAKPPINPELVVCEVYSNFQFRRFIVGKAMIKKHLNLTYEEAMEHVHNKTPLVGGNLLLKGTAVPRVCGECKQQGEIGKDFKICNSYVEAKCKPCSVEYMRLYRLNNSAKIKEKRNKWLKKESNLK